MNDRAIGAGLSTAGAKGLGYTASTALFAGAVGVLGGIVGAIAGGDAKSAGVGGAVGALIGGIFGAVLTYETSQGVSAAAAAVGA